MKYDLLVFVVDVLNTFHYSLLECSVLDEDLILLLDK
jgi:hypothetical protein